jgi:hypothetical protein
MSPAQQASIPEQVTETELVAGPRAAELAQQMSEDLELWATRAEAGLFLAGLAVAHGEEPRPVDGETVTLGSLGDAGEPDEIDELAIVGILADDDADLADQVAGELPGWIAAGAELLAPRLANTDPVEASAEIVELIREAA